LSFGIAGHNDNHYSRSEGCSKDVISFVRQIACTNEPNQLIDIFRKLIEFQFIGMVNIRTMITYSQAHYCHRSRVFDAIHQLGGIPLVHLGFPEFHTSHVHTSWNPLDIWIHELAHVDH
jgi:hypothetical protein